MSEQKEPQLLTAEAADYVGLSFGTLNIYRYRGVGPKGSRIGGRVYYDRADLDAWMELRASGKWSVHGNG